MFLSHINLGDSWDHIQLQWHNLIDGVSHEGLTGMKAWIYTVETDPEDEDIAGDEDMESVAEMLEETYTAIQESLQQFVRCGVVTRETHPFSQVGEAEVDTDGSVQFSNVE